MNQPIIYSYEALKGWFESNKRTKFTLYAGHSNEAKHAIFSQDSDELSLEKSWEVLDKYLDYYLYTGDFYLHVTSSKNGTGGGKNTPIRLSGKFKEQQNAGIAGIAGMVTLESVQGLIENALMKKENEELKQRIAEGLKPQSGGRFWDLIDRAMEEEGTGKDVITGLGEGIKEIGSGVKHLLMNVKLNNAQPKPKALNTPQKPKNTEGGKKRYGVDKMYQVFSETENIFPDTEPQEVHGAIIKMFDDLDDSLKMLMIQKVNVYLKNTEGGTNEC
jgi:hypothetical protein